jgi:hypothetical protein
VYRRLNQACQIFLDTICQNGGKCTKLPEDDPMAMTYSPWAKKHFQKFPKFSIPSPSKMYPNWDFWFENIPSGNPGLNVVACCNRGGKHSSKH